MSLRRKAVLSIGISVAALIAIVYAILQGTLLRRFDEQEASSTRLETGRAVELLEADLENLQTVASDWAKWDDLYAFVGGSNPGFAATNIVDETFRNLHLDVMVFLDRQGRLVVTRSFNHDAKRQTTLPEGLLAHLQAGGRLASHPDVTSHLTGLVLLPEGPLLVTSWPIVRSSGDGPARGTLVWGRFLDREHVGYLAKKAGLALSVHRVDDPAPPPDVRSARAALADADSRVVRPLGETVVAGYAMREDIYGQAALVLRVEQPRLIHQQGRAFATFLVVSLVAVVLASGGVTLGLLDRLVLARVSRLSAEIMRVGETGDLSARVQVTGRDEIASLAGATNATLGSLEQQVARISLLNQITRGIAERQDLASIFRVVLGRLEDHLPIDLGGVLYALRAGVLTVVARGPKSEPVATQLEASEGTEIAVDETALEPCLRGETVHVPDTALDARVYSRRLASLGIRSVVATPLAVEGEVFGILVAARRAIEAFTPAEVDFLRTLGEHVALAAYQTRLHQELSAAYADLRRRQQAAMREERLRALGQMASGIAHDINNALAPIVGFSQLLLRTESGLSERARRRLGTIQTAGEDISHTVRRMREFYRQRDEEEALGQVRLNDVVTQTVELTRPRWKDMAQEQGRVIRVETDLAADLPVVPGIDSELREAFTNLVLNAVDAMPQGGRLTLRTHLAGPRVALEVADTGTGMDETTRQRCLEPFFSTKGDRGTGLGLAMVYGIVKRHEGEIEIESQVGRGTTIRVHFPLPGNPAAAPDPEPEEARPSTSLRVLCIDDEPLVRESVVELLGSEGHRVAVAEGGQAGLDAFRAARRRDEAFDVVITDLGMPYLDGREVARGIKAESPSTPVILLTGWDSRSQGDGPTPPEIDLRLGKPPRLTALQAALARVTRPAAAREDPAPEARPHAPDGG